MEEREVGKKAESREPLLRRVYGFFINSDGHPILDGSIDKIKIAVASASHDWKKGRDGMKRGSQKKEISSVVLLMVLGLLFFASGSRNSNARTKEFDAAKVTVPESLDSSLAAPASGVAIADFTGDTHPDLAVVQFDRFESSNANYWIEVRLTEGTTQILKLTAPVGGLEITPCDVTGDGNLDLIVRTVKGHTPMALFLNDGSGHFSAARLSEFAKALADDSEGSKFTREFVYFSPAVSCTLSHPVEYQIKSLCNIPHRADAFVPTKSGAPRSLLLTFGLTRAPPSRA